MSIDKEILPARIGITTALFQVLDGSEDILTSDFACPLYPHYDVLRSKAETVPDAEDGETALFNEGRPDGFRMDSEDRRGLGEGEESREGEGFLLRFGRRVFDLRDSGELD